MGNSIFTQKYQLIITKSLILVFWFFFCNFSSQAAEVGGIIEADTKWTAAESPYNVVGNILVSENVTLEIEPGTVIRFGIPPLPTGYYIQVDGTLRAEGSEGQPILFTAENSESPWGCIAFMDKSRDWNEITSKGSVLDHCVIEYAGNNQEAAIVCISAAPMISNNIIRQSLSNGIRTLGGSQKIVGNLIHHTVRGMHISCERGRIENNYITESTQGIFLDSGKYGIDIKNNTIEIDSPEVYGACLSINLYYNSDTATDEAAADAVAAAETASADAQTAADALSTADENYFEAYAAAKAAREKAQAAADMAQAMIQAAVDAAGAMTSMINIHNNRIVLSNDEASAIAITEHSPNANYELSIRENDIEVLKGKLAVLLYGWQQRGPSLPQPDMTGNWWGTTDIGEIDGLIYDADNDFYLPRVMFEPISNEKIPGSGSSLSYESEPDDPDEPDEPGELPDAPGIISKDTVWTVENSPYLISGNILVKENVRLEIEPGVEIQFKTPQVTPVGYYIQVDGTLRAQGTRENPIFFTAEDSGSESGRPWGGIVFTDSSADWDEAAGEGSVLSHCLIEYAGNSQEGGAEEFANIGILCLSASPRIADNTIRYVTGDCIRISGGTADISGNLIHDSSRGITIIASQGGVIENNYITATQQGIFSGLIENRLEIRNNTISSVSPEIYGSCLSVNLSYHNEASEIVVSRNHFISTNPEANAISIRTQSPDTNDKLVLEENNIENQGNLSVYLHNWQPEIPKALHMENNWWGAAEKGDIGEMIYDSENDFYLPEVRYEPFATEQIADAGSGLSYEPEPEPEPETPDEEIPDDLPWVISEDTVWTAEGSPWLIDGNVLVRENVRLDIEAGAEVRFRTAPVASVGYYIRVDGTLSARGTEQAPILLTAENADSPWGAIAFMDKSTDWDETGGEGSILSHCIIEHAGNAQEGGTETDFAEIGGGAAVKCFSASPLIENNIIRYVSGDALWLSGGSHNIRRNRIHQCTRGIVLLSESIVAENNYIRDCGQGIWLNSGGKKTEIRNNSIISASPAVYGSCISVNLYRHDTAPEILIQGNHLINSNPEGNAIAISTQDPEANYNLIITENNIDNAGGNLAVYLYNWQQKDTYAPDMGNNWWGTDNGEDIDEMIYDAENDFYLPDTDYGPVREEMIPGAWSDLVYPPVANAGRDMPFEGGEPVVGDMVVPLDGSLSPDPDQIMSYEWVQISGTSVNLSDADTPKASFVAPAVVPDNALLIFRLRVTDPVGFYDTDEVSITIDPFADTKMEREEGQCFISAVSCKDRQGPQAATFENQAGKLAGLVFLGMAVMLGIRCSVRTGKSEPSCMAGGFVNPPGAFLFAAAWPENLSIRRERSFSPPHGRRICQSAGSVPFRRSVRIAKSEPSAILNSFAGKIYKQPLITMALILCLAFLRPDSAFSEGYYFTTGIGAGGGAGTYNLSLQSGVMGIEIGEKKYLIGAGIPIIPHGYDNIPKDTFDYPCPHDEYSIMGEENDGTELGLFGRMGVEMFHPDMYVSMLLGFTRGTEIQVSESDASGKHYEQASEKKVYWLYGLGLGYFTEVFDDEWHLAFLLDLDNRRGISGSVGFHW
ncbi:MAG: hypothetical protein B6245_10460 [Desulfobacteraceae bacterium 4572_88]|nr:MAG: hypothetical protein B6245_10460 [Desulfobacteraceae bacterium 4572_88]